MPTGPLRVCTKPGCRTLVVKGRCPAHPRASDPREIERRQRVDAARPKDVRSRYYSPRWRKERAEFLSTHPTCTDATEGHICGAKAEAVDHVRPWRREPDPEAAFWNRSNWAPICWRHHSKKTAKHDGGFGNPRVGG